MSDLFSLKGRVALVTGASRGLGLAMARALANAGAHVVVNARDAVALAEAAEQLGAEAMAFDVTDAKVARAALEDIAARHGKLDILVNNAGIQHRRAITDWEDEDFDRVIAV
ncbi:MAG: SDR family NAD(P)-dependent oxidoreductase, partial [Alphaproteobacteria bacterium]|nr:SDR family NAD(P)-dependent oxidoreductase [Alphaproteobacteria bacterium]